MLALIAGLVAAGGSVAELLGLKLEFPLIGFDNQGETVYTASDGLLEIEASPTAIRLSAGDPPILITPTPVFGEVLSINARLDAGCSLVGGVPGDDLVVVGEVAAWECSRASC